MVGYILTAVTLIESDGEFQMTVAITMPIKADPMEKSFFLLVNTVDRTATGLPWIQRLELCLYTYQHSL